MTGWLGTAGEQLIVLFFVVTGLSNLTKARIADHIERMRAFGTPFPAALFWLGIALQFAGCAMIELAWHPAVGVGCLIIFTVAATAIFHRFWRKRDPVQRNFSRLTLLGNAAVLGGLLLLLERMQ
jgi:putative oxidoreductase